MGHSPSHSRQLYFPTRLPKLTGQGYGRGNIARDEIMYSRCNSSLVHTRRSFKVSSKRALTTALERLHIQPGRIHRRVTATEPHHRSH